MNIRWCVRVRGLRIAAHFTIARDGDDLLLAIAAVIGHCQTGARRAQLVGKDKRTVAIGARLDLAIVPRGHELGDTWVKKGRTMSQKEITTTTTTIRNINHETHHRRRDQMHTARLPPP